jgi:HPr kinase/phosphorylase
MGDSMLVHGTAISVDRRAVLVRGPSGSGKSDLALRALAVTSPIFARSPPALVADDQVIVAPAGSTLEVRSPGTLRGLIEVRGLGIQAVPTEPAAQLVLCADILPPTEIERLPDPPANLCLFGIAIPLIRIAAFEHSAPLKLLLALAAARPVSN